MYPESNRSLEEPEANMAVHTKAEDFETLINHWDEITKSLKNSLYWPLIKRYISSNLNKELGECFLRLMEE